MRRLFLLAHVALGAWHCCGGLEHPLNPWRSFSDPSLIKLTTQGSLVKLLGQSSRTKQRENYTTTFPLSYNNRLKVILPLWK